VALDGHGGDHQNIGYLLVGEPLRQQRQDLELAFGQGVHGQGCGRPLSRRATRQRLLASVRECGEQLPGVFSRRTLLAGLVQQCRHVAP
jgi:hypothetical protein